MTLGQHLASISTGALASVGTLDLTVPEVPTTKAQIISVLTAVVVQSIILCFTWLRKKLSKQKPTAEINS